MRTIFRFEAEGHLTMIEVPYADPLPVLFAMRTPADEWPTLWCEVNTARPAIGTPHRFIVHGTGHPIANNEVHVASTIDQPRELVWHLYRIIEA